MKVLKIVVCLVALGYFLWIGFASHDWNYILTRLGVVSMAPTIGAVVQWLGISIIILAGIIGIISAWRDTSSTQYTL